MNNNTSMIIESAVKPLSPNIKLHKSYKVLYVTDKKPSAVVRDTLVLSSPCPTDGTLAYIPHKEYEFDFWNEYEGFLQDNPQLKVESLDYSKIHGGDYVADLENMILYQYESIPVAYEERFVLEGRKIVSKPKKNYFSNN
jgi:hypothetical protein